LNTLGTKNDRAKRLNREALYEVVRVVGGDDGHAWCEFETTKIKRKGIDQIVEWNMALQDCLSREWISEETARLSTIGTHTTIKCYATTLVGHLGVRDFMKHYSRLMTVLYRRFTIVINLMAMDAASGGEQDIEAFLVDLKAQTFLKKAMLPEKWIDNLASERISKTYADNKDILAPLTASVAGWESLMPRHAWDQALNSLRSKYSTAIKVHITCHLISRIKKVVRASAKDGDNAVTYFFVSKNRKLGLSADDANLVKYWKNLLGVGFKAQLPKMESKKLTPKLFYAHMACCSATDTLKEVKGFSHLPVADLSRSFFMIDRRMYNALIKKHPEWPPTFETAFSTDGPLFKAKKLAVRKKLRGKLKTEDRRNVRDKLKRIAKRGVGRLPKNAVVTSISTDGVSLCVGMILPYVKSTGDEVYLDEAEAHGTECLQKEGDSKVLSNDPGCKLIYCMGVSHDGTSNEGSVDVWSLSDEELYEQSGRRKYAQLEKAWMQGKPMVKAALEAMGEGALKCGDSTRWRTCLKAQAEAWAHLEMEYVIDDRRAKANMRLLSLRPYEFRESSLSKCFQGFKEWDKTTSIGIRWWCQLFT
jgi:hypothetical protein